MKELTLLLLDIAFITLIYTVIGALIWGLISVIAERRYTCLWIVPGWPIALLLLAACFVSSLWGRSLVYYLHGSRMIRIDAESEVEPRGASDGYRMMKVTDEEWSYIMTQRGIRASGLEVEPVQIKRSTD